MSIDAAHFHLMLNHVPVIGAPLLLLLLTIGLVRGSRELVTITLVLTVGLALAAGAVYLTGEPAEHLVDRAPWFRESLAEAHEEIAEIAALVSGATGVLALAALLVRRGGSVWLPRAVWTALAATTLLLGWTAWSGGRIRHDEVRGTAIIPGSSAGD